MLLQARTRVSGKCARYKDLKSALALRKSRKIHTRTGFFKVSEEVQTAIREKTPVVALESTIYTHGFPFPNNLELACNLESLARANGAVPATCGIVDGVARVGMNKDELGVLVKDPAARKGLSSGSRLNGGTTISGTMVLAHLAGIKVFATGGLGGVHRGGESSMDISADLTEFARTPVAVVSAGCKGFLDIPRTLEYLETQGAAVATFADGRQGKVDFPAFWCRDSGVKSPIVVRDEAEAAAMIFAQHNLPLSSGQLFANPVPAEFAIPFDEMQVIIQRALHEADEAGVIGSENTPFVLEAIRRLSQGRSIPANVALIEANVVRGAKVAVELAKLESAESRKSASLPGRHAGSETFHDPPWTSQPAPSKVLEQPQGPVDVLVAGSVALDLSCDYSPVQGQLGDSTPQLGTSNPAEMRQTLGGVGNNITRAVHAGRASVRLCSVVADDTPGKSVLEQVQALGLDTSGISTIPVVSSAAFNTAQYVSVNNAHKDLVIAMADMRILEHSGSHFTDEVIAHYLETSRPKWLIVDTNWDARTLHLWIKRAKAAGVPVALEPVSAAKSTRLFTSGTESPIHLPTYPNTNVDIATPNVHELGAMYAAAKQANLFDRPDWWHVIDFLGISASGARAELVQATSTGLVDAGVPQMTIQLLPFIPCILTKLGADGVLMTKLLGVEDKRLHSPDAAPFILSRAKSDEAMLHGVGGVYMRHFKAVEKLEQDAIVSVNGAGDTFMGFLIAQLAKHTEKRIEHVIDEAQMASVLTLQSPEAVSPRIVTQANLRVS